VLLLLVLLEGLSGGRSVSRGVALKEGFMSHWMDGEVWQETKGK